MNAPKSNGRAAQTRDALVAAGLEIFGRDGFHAASTRAIAESAGVNQALIAYHFGGKEGLYRATIESITANITAHMGPLLEEMQSRVSGLDAGTPEGQAECLVLMEQIMAGAVELFGRPEAAQWVKLVMREQQDPTDAFDIFYRGIYSDMLELFTVLTGKIMNRAADEEAVRVRALTLMGQILVFVVGRGTVARHVGWTQLGERERSVLHGAAVQSLQSLIIQPEGV